MPHAPNPFADEPLPEGPRLQSAGDPLNPYAAPVNADPLVRPEKVGVWRDGPLLVMHRRAKLPETCVVTGEPTQQRHWETVRWSQPVDYRDRALVVEYGIQPTILRKRNGLPLIPVLLAVALWVVTFAGFAFYSQLNHLEGSDAEDALGIAMMISFVGTGLIFLPFIVSRWRSKFIRLVHVEKYYVWLSGPSEAFLRTLPAWSEMNRGG